MKNWTFRGSTRTKNKEKTIEAIKKYAKSNGYYFRKTVSKDGIISIRLYKKSKYEKGGKQ